MKLCIIDPVGNPGGGSRFLRCLVPALKERRPSLSVRLLAPRAVFAREAWREVQGVELVELKSTRWAQEGLPCFPASASAVRYLQGRFQGWLGHCPGRVSGNFRGEVRKKSAGADLTLFPWPYLSPLPPVKGPVAAVFHDFNFKYFFGGYPALLPWQQELVEREMPRWLAAVRPVVTSEFMAGELARFYPEYRDKAVIIRMPPMSPPAAPGKPPAEDVLARYGLTSPYVLYPCNLHAHKNIGPLIVAMARLAERGLPCSLVLTGPYTDRIRGRAERWGLVRGTASPNVVGLGYVPHDEMAALVESAVVIVSSSLYEAGNGPGLEGWARGRPVAMSDIPSFTEHMRVWGVHAELFDPRFPESIADALGRILEHPEQARARALESREKMSANTWSRAADGYLELFDRMTRETPP